MSNLDLWRSVEKTDPAYTKGFSRGGGFRGTSTNATYLAMKATETFGPMGIGWGVEVLDEELMQGTPLGDGVCETIHKVRVKLWYVHGDKRGEAVQFGQTTVVGKNRNGLFTHEEAPKKSLTDGMSKCLSLLGFSADIHLGRYDDNKYVADLKQEFAEKAKAEAPRVTASQASELARLISVTGTDKSAFCAHFDADDLGDVAASRYDEAVKLLMRKKAKAKTEEKAA